MAITTSLNSIIKRFQNTRPGEYRISDPNKKKIAAATKKHTTAQTTTLEKAVQKGYKSDLVLNNSRAFYDGCDTYTVIYDGYNVKIINETKDYTLNLNLYNLVSTMNETDRVAFLLDIQKMPGEALEDLYYEVDRLDSSRNANMHTIPTNNDFVAGGYFSPKEDKIVTGSKHLVHELGHAVDFGVNGKAESLKNKEFCDAFNRGLADFLADGNVQYDYNDKSTWGSSNNSDPAARIVGAFSGNSNYCMANPLEMFAEIYSLLMTGHCKSENTIRRYFSECVEIGKTSLANCRARNAEQRHHNPTRRIFEALG